MKKIVILLGTVVFMGACGDNKSENGNNKPPTSMITDTSQDSNSNPSYDPNRGEGKFTKVDISLSLNSSMADDGEKIYGVKCIGCHKLTDEKLVGPGWKGVTTRHTPEWIMNFATNPDPMLDKDPKAQALLQLCLVRMPNQNISDTDARAVYEFMRKNDGVK